MIKEINVISLKAYNNPDDQNLADDYKRKKIQVISELRNKYISYYCDQLDLHANDLSKCWKILKATIGRDSNLSKLKIQFSIRGFTVTDNITYQRRTHDYRNHTRTHTQQ